MKIKNYKLKITECIYIVFLFPIIIFSSCANKETQIESEKFCLSEQMKKDLKLEKVSIQPVSIDLMFTGKIKFNEDKVVKVFPLAGGLVEEIKVELGDFVSRGQVLATVRSSDIADFQNQLKTAQSKLLVMKKNLEVAEEMNKSGLLSDKELVSAKSDLVDAQGDYDRVKEILSIMGEGGVKSAIYHVKAPISGYVVEKNVSEKMQFRSDNTGSMFTISNIDDVWAIANVYEFDIAKIKLGMPADIAAISYPGKFFTGKIDKIYNVLDPESKSLKVRINIDNRDKMLKDEMFCSVHINYPENRNMLSVPSNSVIFDRNKYYVMIYHGNCDIETREISVYKEHKGYTYISNGVSENEQIISNIQLLVYDALND